MVADVLATQGARASATMIFTMLNRINPVPAREELTLKRLGHFFQNVILFFNVVQH